MARIFFVLLFWLLGSALAWCQTNVMKFSAFPPNPIAEKAMGFDAWTIYASGKIDAQAGKRLSALIAEKQIPIESLIYLNSPGGSLLGGMRLGRVIRENELYTYIGQFNPTSKLTIGSNPGYCFSACALAFLGGEYRYLDNSSIYGMQDFSGSSPQLVTQMSLRLFPPTLFNTSSRWEWTRNCFLWRRRLALLK